MVFGVQNIAPLIVLVLMLAIILPYLLKLWLLLLLLIELGRVLSYGLSWLLVNCATVIALAHWIGIHHLFAHLAPIARSWVRLGAAHLVETGPSSLVHVIRCRAPLILVINVLVIWRLRLRQDLIGSVRCKSIPVIILVFLLTIVHARILRLGAPVWFPTIQLSIVFTFQLFCLKVDLLALLFGFLIMFVSKVTKADSTRDNECH